jgi:hypothetical protein
MQAIEFARQRLKAALATRRITRPWMIRPNPLLEVYGAEQASANRIIAAHRRPTPSSKGAQCANSAIPFHQPVLIFACKEFEAQLFVSAAAEGGFEMCIAGDRT